MKVGLTIGKVAVLFVNIYIPFLYKQRFDLIVHKDRDTITHFALRKMCNVLPPLQKD